MTAKKSASNDLATLLEEVGEAAEANADAPITNATTVTRGHGRSKTLQIRLNPEELEELERIADDRGLPTSTVAREAILRLIRPRQARSVAARRLADDFHHYLVDYVVSTDESREARFAAVVNLRNRLVHGQPPFHVIGNPDAQEHLALLTYAFLSTLDDVADADSQQSKSGAPQD